MVILFSSPNPLLAKADFRFSSLRFDITVRRRPRSKFCCLRGTSGAVSGLWKMTNKWHTHKGRGRSISRSNGPFSAISRTHNSSTLKQSSGSNFGFHSASLSSPCDLSLPWHQASSLFHHLMDRAIVIPIIIFQRSTALCKPRPRFSCL